MEGNNCDQSVKSAVSGRTGKSNISGQSNNTNTNLADLYLNKDQQMDQLCKRKINQ